MKVIKSLNKVVFTALLILFNRTAFPQTVTGSGTTNYVTKWTNGGSSVIGNSLISDDGSEVGIGIAAPIFKFQVLNGFNYYQNVKLCNDTVPNSSFGIYSTTSTGTGKNISVYGVAYDNNSSNAGGRFFARGNLTDTINCSINYGVQGKATGDGFGNDPDYEWRNNIGVFGESKGGKAFNVGGIFEAINTDANCTGESFGVFASANSGNIICGIYAEALNDSSCTLDTIHTTDSILNTIIAAYFNGNVVTTGDYFKTSDERLKKNVKDVENVSELLSKLTVKQYLFNQEKYPGMRLPKGMQYGVMAQETEKIFPNLVLNMQTPLPPPSENRRIRESYEMKAVNYDGFIPLLIAAHNELKENLEQKNNQLEKELTELKALVKQICEEGCGKVNGIQQGQINEELLEIYPNPADESVKVNFLVKTGKTIQLELLDLSGKILKNYSFESITGRQVIDVSHLPSGSYLITLKADGKIIKSQTISITR